jgi:hypothetical protein
VKDLHGLFCPSIGTKRWSWWKPATTFALMPASASAVAIAAVSPTASSAEWTSSVMHAAT